MLETKSFTQVSIKSFILLWAFAETSIGGVLHALKLPFTGILVGGVAVISIALIGFYQKEGSKSIMEALAIVLMIKLLVSPHSPWQAYIAVFFQGYLGSLIYRRKNNFKLKTLIFALIALFESAVQKLLVALLIFGNNFFDSLDLAADSVIGSFGWDAEFSLVYTVFNIYIFLHLLTGLLLGLWIPKIPLEINSYMESMPYFKELKPIEPKKLARFKKRMWLSLGIFIIILIILKWLLPETRYSELLWMFLRALLISMLLVVVVGPLIKHWVKKIIANRNINTSSWNDIIDILPRFSMMVSALLKFVRAEYKGMARIKHFLLGIIVLSIKVVNE